MTIINFAGTPVLIKEDGFVIAKTKKNDPKKIFLYLKDTYFHPTWLYNNGITFPYFLPKFNTKKATRN